jgi:hypothetical protein
MAKHSLALDIPDTLNENIFKILDSSIYSKDVPTECPKIEVILPGFQVPATITAISPSFSINLDACQLNIQNYNCGVQFNPLPDGVYVVRYSLSPNDIVYVEYNHLRITKALNKIYKILCCLDLKAAKPDKSIKVQLAEIHELEVFLKGAKANVEFCHHPVEGINLYNYVIKQLDRLSCKCGCSQSCN